MPNEDPKTDLDLLDNWKRTHDCGSIKLEHEGQEVILMGWVNSRRDLGNLIFIDLRDRGGLTQVVFDPNLDEISHLRAHVLRNEWVVAVKGIVSPRLKGQENADMPTGEIELKVKEIKILNRAETPPFQVDGYVDASETLRLKHRYIELRRPDVFNLFLKRHRIAARIRSYLNNNGFIEVETPFLTKSTPEGARDYLVPSRVSRGMFYALPQSPQLFKQLLMVGGFDRYYQIVRCFRDEDLRTDRQPEFTQVDLEMAFVKESDVMDIFEGMMKDIFAEALGHEISLPITRLQYHDAMDRFGTDRPDMRFGMEFKDISDVAERSDFMVFKGVVENGGLIKAIKVKKGAPIFSRKTLDEFSKVAVSQGAKGLSWIKITENGWQSSLNKFFKAAEQDTLNKRIELKTGDLVLIVADQGRIVNSALGALRLAAAHKMKLVRDNIYSFVWVTKFPLFEYNETEQRLEAMHHPFTAPVEEDISLLNSQPEAVRARSYDLVLNGTEIGGGSVRIHNPEIQQKLLDIMGISAEKAHQKFGFLIEALKYGAPPHGGMALGFDRLVAIMTGVGSIREVIAFPKTTSATCPLTGAPSAVDEEQLKELGINLNAG